ncbi:MAG: NYN domain-containing protein [Bacteroidota bacterium]
MEGQQNVAIYLDFENLAISAETVYPSQDKPLDLEPIVDYATTKGVICIRRAYANWSKDIFAQYQSRLMEQGFELVHLPETNFQGKNGSDVRLAVDVMEYMEIFSGIDTLVIGSGDTDFIPLIQRLRSRGKSVVVLGFEHSVGTLVKRNSTEFKALEELIGEPEEESLSSDLVDEPDISRGRRLLLRYLKSRNSEDAILMSQLKQQLLRLDPSFSEKELGFSSFKQFIVSFTGDVVEKVVMQDDTLPVVYLQQPEESGQPVQLNSKENAGQFLAKKLRYQKKTTKRLLMSQALYNSIRNGEALSMNQMFEDVHEQIKPKIAKTDIKKYINTLFTGGAFISTEKNGNGPLLSRPFKLDDTIQSPEGLDQIYIRRVSEILQSRYTDLEPTDILELLI